MVVPAYSNITVVIIYIHNWERRTYFPFLPRTLHLVIREGCLMIAIDLTCRSQLTTKNKSTTILHPIVFEVTLKQVALIKCRQCFSHKLTLFFCIRFRERTSYFCSWTILIIYNVGIGITFRSLSCRPILIGPVCTIIPFSNPYRTPLTFVWECLYTVYKRSTVLIFFIDMCYSKVATISQLFDEIEEITIPYPNRRWSRWAKTQSTLKHLWPHLNHSIYWCIGLVRTVRFVTAKQMGYTRLWVNVVPWRPSEILSNRRILHIGIITLTTYVPVVVASDIKYIFLTITIGFTLLRSIVPAEYTNKRHKLLHSLWHYWNFKVFISSNKYATVARTVSIIGKCCHITLLKLERADAIIPCTKIVVICIDFKLFGITREILTLICSKSTLIIGGTIRYYHRTICPHCHTTIHAIFSLCTTYLNRLQPVIDNTTRLYIVEV